MGVGGISVLLMLCLFIYWMTRHAEGNLVIEITEKRSGERGKLDVESYKLSYGIPMKTLGRKPALDGILEKFFRSYQMGGYNREKTDSLDTLIRSVKMHTKKVIFCPTGDKHKIKVKITGGKIFFCDHYGTFMRGKEKQISCGLGRDTEVCVAVRVEKDSQDGISIRIRYTLELT